MKHSGSTYACLGAGLRFNATTKPTHQRQRRTRDGQHFAAWICRFSGRCKCSFWSERAVGILLPSARAQTTAAGSALLDKGFAKFKVGDWNVTTIYDGVWERPLDPTLAANAPIDEVKAAAKAAGYPETHVPITFTVTVVERAGETIMFDSGTGGGQAGGPKAGLLAKQNMKAAGIETDKIAKIIVTHYHSDHIFGMMEKDTNTLLYPNAEIIVPASEHTYWTEPGLIEKLPAARQGLAKRIQATIPTWKNVRQVADNAEVVPGIRSINTNGHTPGHTAYALGSGSGQLLISGDVTNVHELSEEPGLVFLWRSRPSTR